MKLSSRSEYGVRAVLFLAAHHGGGPVSLREIALGEGLSEQYLVQIFADLRKARLVQSVRGAQGGFVLSGEPTAIRLGEVVRALEKDLGPADCVGEHAGDCCERTDHCATRHVWQKVRDGITSVLDGMTLAEVLAEAGEAAVPLIFAPERLS